MERDDGSLLGAAGGPDPRHEPAPLPLARAIAWVPRGADQAEWPPHGARPVRTPLFVTSGVLRAVQRHLSGSRTGTGFGFLAGRLFRCPRSDVPYALVESAHAGRDALAEQASGEHLERAWRDLEGAPDGIDRLLLGWYHGHDRHGLLLTDPDRETNRRYFGAPWQFSIVVVSRDGRPLGGVFRQAGTSPEEPSRPMPFFELLSKPHGGDLASVESAVDWTNYEPNRPLPPSIPGDPTLVRAVPEAAGADGPMRPGVPLVIPGEGAPTGLLPPRSRRLARPIVIAGLLVLVAVAALLIRGADDPAPVVTRPVPSRPAPSPTRPSPEFQALLDRVAELELAGERYAERAGDFDAGRIGCALLAPGYVAADEAYVEVSAAFRAAGAPNPAMSDAYERAGREIAAVNDHFDATGCERP